MQRFIEFLQHISNRPNFLRTLVEICLAVALTGSAKVRKRLSVVSDNVLIEGLEKATLEVNEVVRSSTIAFSLPTS